MQVQTAFPADHPALQLATGAIGQVGKGKVQILRWAYRLDSAIRGAPGGHVITRADGGSAARGGGLISLGTGGRTRLAGVGAVVADTTDTCLLQGLAKRADLVVGRWLALAHGVLGSGKREAQYTVVAVAVNRRHGYNALRVR